MGEAHKGSGCLPGTSCVTGPAGAHLLPRHLQRGQWTRLSLTKAAQDTPSRSLQGSAHQVAAEALPEPPHPPSHTGPPDSVACTWFIWKWVL